MPKTFLSAISVLYFSIVLTQAAPAAIVCKDGFQNSGGTWISTPYCNDAHLAQIARQHGVSVSAAEIRANPNAKYEVCRLIGTTAPARDYCPDEGSRSGR